MSETIQKKAAEAVALVAGDAKVAAAGEAGNRTKLVLSDWDDDADGTGLNAVAGVGAARSADLEQLGDYSVFTRSFDREAEHVIATRHVRHRGRGEYANFVGRGRYHLAARGAVPNSIPPELPVRFVSETPGFQGSGSSALLLLRLQLPPC